MTASGEEPRAKRVTEKMPGKFLAKLNCERLEEILEATYGDARRHYHGLTHLSSMLRTLQDKGQLDKVSDEFLVALLFHDAVYDIRAKDNEDKSAEMCLETLPEIWKGDLDTNEVRRLIEATKHDRDMSEAGDEEKLLSDVDMGGLESAEHMVYGENIIREYLEAYTREQVLQGRVAFFNKLIKDKIFYTKYFDERKARENINEAIGVMNDELKALKRRRDA